MIKRANERDELLVSISEAFANPIRATGLFTSKGNLSQSTRVGDDVNCSGPARLCIEESFNQSECFGQHAVVVGVKV
jgi:hypothetical protein